MNCPECNSHKKQGLGGESFECKDCGWFYADPVLGSTLEHQKQFRYEESIRCPECGELTEGIGENLEYLENLHTYNDGYRDTKGWFHPDCWTEYQRHQRFLEIAERKQVELLEKVSQVPCPHCGSQEIVLSPGTAYPYRLRPYWECMNCDEEIDKKWLISQLKSLELAILAG